MTTAIATKYKLYDEASADGAFLGADNDLDRVIQVAIRLVSGRRYSMLQVLFSMNNAVVARVFFQDGNVWVTTNYTATVASSAMEDPQTEGQMELPGVDWSQF